MRHCRFALSGKGCADNRSSSFPFAGSSSMWTNQLLGAAKPAEAPADERGPHHLDVRQSSFEDARAKSVKMVCGGGMHRITVIILSVMAGLVLAIFGIPFLLDANSFRPKIEAELGRALGREVKIGDLKLSIFKGTITAGNLSVADDPAF